MSRILKTWAPVVAVLALAGCVSRSEVLHDYVQIAPKQARSRGRPTLVFFLIDGFSVAKAQELLTKGALPETRRYFLGDGDRFRLGRAVFPTLTHANLSSIVTSRNVDAQPVLGNQVRIDGETLNFESPLNESKLSELLRPYSVFRALARQGRRSVSFAPYYGEGATARYPLDPTMGVAYGHGDFEFVDGRLIESLDRLLKGTRPNEWPELIFVHLVGIDSFQHRQGLNAAAVEKHARFVDARLASVYARLAEAEAAGHPVGAILTADHGMNTIVRQISLDKLVAARAPGSVRINQARLYTVAFAKNQTQESRRAFAAELGAVAGIESSVLRDRDRLHVFAQGRHFEIKTRPALCPGETPIEIAIDASPFACPSAVDAAAMFFHPYFATNLVTFFRATTAPDLLIIPVSGVSFGSGPGSHGGPTAEEVFVPVFSRNVFINEREPVVRTYRLLESLNPAAP